MKNIYPLKLKPVIKNIVWGGDKLSRDYGIGSCPEKIAEAWLLTVRNDGMSIIENGNFCGKTLEEYISSVGNTAVGNDFSLDRFPMLIKFIDARDDLSIQVHPDDVFAKENENEFGKTEMWYIVEAQPDAKIVYGLVSGCSKEDFCRAVTENNYKEVLNYINVKAGETYYIPSGLVHAICGGILIAEIQQNSNITYRVYDYGRIGQDGHPRELHTEKAQECLKIFSEKGIDALRYSSSSSNRSEPGEILAASKYFNVKKLTLGSEKATDEVSSKSFHSVICTDGSAEIITSDESYHIKKGESYFLPAGLGKYDILSRSGVSLIISEMA